MRVLEAKTETSVRAQISVPADSITKRCEEIQTRESLVHTLGQYWPLLHFFPTFLARLVSLAPSLSMKTQLAKILNQELGEGSLDNAHEVLFFKNLKAVGIESAEVAFQPLLPTTRLLLRQFEEGSEDFLTGLGVLQATEMMDLMIVRGLANAIRRVTGATTLTWEEIHVKQEPDHVSCTIHTLSQLVNSPLDRALAEIHAQASTSAWEGFFQGLTQGSK